VDKQALRQSVRQRRAARSTEDQIIAADAIAARAVAFLPQQPGNITCFMSMPGEPGTGPLLSRLLERGHRVWMPRIMGHALSWVHVTADTEYVTGPLGIREPVGPAVESLEFADVVLMPALAVDPAGRRLGQGGGYYDGALADLPVLVDGGPMLVALVHDDEVVDEVPIEEHDRLVDAIVTPRRTLRTGRAGRLAREGPSGSLPD